MSVLELELELELELGLGLWLWLWFGLLSWLGLDNAISALDDLLNACLKNGYIHYYVCVYVCEYA